jgi:hypothetical protein
MTKSLFRRVAAVALVTLLALPAPVVRAQDSIAADTRESRLTGKVMRPDGTPVSGATILSYHLASEQIFSSSPTAGGGEFEVLGLPFGYFDLAVETDEGLFVGNQVVNVPPSGKLALVFTVQPHATGDDEAGREFPGMDRPSSGVANVRQRVSGREFWRGPRGIAIIAGVGGAALLLAANESDASPIVP